MLVHFNRWCVYQHWVDGRMIYIGSGTSSRACEQGGRNGLWRAAVEEAGGFVVRIMDWFDTEHEARAYEAAAIVEHSPECNIVKGFKAVALMEQRGVPGISRRLAERREWWRQKTA